MAPAVDGTLNVLKACVEANVKRVVYVSSAAALMMNPNWSKNQVIDESCWSDLEFCKRTEVKRILNPSSILTCYFPHLLFTEISPFWQNWYCASKTQAESEAFEFAKRTGISLVSICPTMVFGPVLQQHTVNASTLALAKLLKGIITSWIFTKQLWYMGC